MFQDLRYVFINTDVRVWITGVIMVFALLGIGSFAYDYFNKKFWDNVDYMIEKRIDEMVDQNPVTIDIDFNPYAQGQPILPF